MQARRPFFTLLRLLAFTCMMTTWLHPHASTKRLSTLEEFYRLYYLPSYAKQDDYHRNMFWLQVALKAPFAVPLHALSPPTNPRQYQKYQHLMRMHLYYLLTHSSVRLAARFDKHRPVFHDKPFKEDILMSLRYARYHYEVADSYWQETLRHYREAVRSREVVPLPFLNRLVFRIHSGDLDYHRVIRRRLIQLEEKRKFYEAL